MDCCRDRVMSLQNWIVGLRREIHSYPEVCYQEERTSALVAGTLAGLGLEVRKGVGRTGVVGLWRSGRPGRCLALRADMDALNLQEETGHEWASKIPGKMHACGHDLHTAMLLGVARALAEDEELKNRLAGSVKLIFQPAEEGGAGAAAMIEDGVLNDPTVDAIFAAHVLPVLEVGQIGYCRGASQAAVDNFYIEIQGRGGHAAHPDLALDPLRPGADLVGVMSSKAASLDKALVAICQFHAGTQTNIIPEYVKISGTIRSLDPGDRQKALDIVQDSALDLQGRTDLKVSVRLEQGYPMLFNDDAMMDFLIKVAGDLLGPENVLPQGPSYGAEDMAYFLQAVPGVNYDLGCRKAVSGPVPMLHSPRFDPDEAAMAHGVELMLRLAEDFLRPA